MTHISQPLTLRPKRPFAAIPKGIVEHVLSGRLRATGFALYVWLHLRADHRTGTVWTHAVRLAAELGLHPVTVRRQLSALKCAGYIRYQSPPGGQKAHEITIEKYHERSDESRGALHDALHDGLHGGLQGGLHGALHGGLHKRPGTPRNGGDFSPPKNKEVRINTPLRVRAADPIHPETLQDEVPEKLLSKAEALAQAPPALRETLELFCFKTGRDGVAPGELGWLHLLDQAHMPAVIQKAITTALERFEQRGEDPATLTLRYLWESLRHYTTRQPRRGQREPERTAKYPIGLMRL